MHGQGHYKTMFQPLYTCLEDKPNEDTCMHKDMQGLACLS